MPETRSFFDGREQFDHLQRRLLPSLIELARKGHRLRIWSPGCGRGEEPYSIAMTILDVAPDARALDIRILATDSNLAALDHARAATFSRRELATVPELFKARWIEPAQVFGERGGRFDTAVRDLVRFETMRVDGPYPLHGYFNAIFCRNVLSSLSETARRKAWADMMPLLAPGGILYTGPAERITGPALGELSMAGNAAYQRLAA